MSALPLMMMPRAMMVEEEPGRTLTQPLPRGTTEVWNVRRVRAGSELVKGKARPAWKFQAVIYGRKLRPDGLPLWTLGRALGPLRDTIDVAREDAIGQKVPRCHTACHNGAALLMHDLFDVEDEAAWRLAGNRGLVYANGRTQGRYNLGLALRSVDPQSSHGLKRWTLEKKIGSVSERQLIQIQRLTGLNLIHAEYMPRTLGAALRVTSP
jgi:hypothetical protein